jgi:hypothetical protein
MPAGFDAASVVDLPAIVTAKRITSCSARSGVVREL